MKDGGASVMNFGHLDAGTQLAGGIDNFSIQCMACHEELGGELQVRVSGRLIRHGGNRVSHPVGVRYADSIAFGGYRPVATAGPNDLPYRTSIATGTITIAAAATLRNV